MTQIDWSGILTITCVGFCLVIVMLLLLVFVMKGFGSFFTHQRKKQSPSQTELDDFEHQAGLLALELENSRINSNARLQKISYERLFIENKRKSIRHFD